jgi:HK97 gp10 family phage protein
VNVFVDEVRGLADLDRFLATLAEEVQRKMLYSSLMSAAKPVMDQAKANVRREFGASLDYTGTLERGITRGRRRKTGLAARVDVKLRRGRPASASTVNGVRKPYGDDPFYGRFLELGTSKMAAKPWLKPAGIARQADAGRELNKALQKQIAKWCRANGVTYKPGAS